MKLHRKLKSGLTHQSAWRPAGPVKLKLKVVLFSVEAPTTTEGGKKKENTAHLLSATAALQMSDSTLTASRLCHTHTDDSGDVALCSHSSTLRS